eukprot:6401897-Amphidinium_carterae.1
MNQQLRQFDHRSKGTARASRGATIHQTTNQVKVPLCRRSVIIEGSERQRAITFHCLAKCGSAALTLRRGQCANPATVAGKPRRWLSE